ncbi:MAG: phosphatase PAP2 family protein [Promethearchaeota archaeon]
MKIENRLSKRALIIIGIIWILIFSVGLVLIFTLNTAFSSDNIIIWWIFFIITYMGDAIVLILIMGVLYIAYDKNYAKKLVYSVLASVYINSFIKDLFRDPRPATNKIEIEPDYGFPSGHSQNSVAAYGYIAYEFKDRHLMKIKIIPLLCSTIIFFIAISRVIIGVHDVDDIIGGLLIGIVFLVLYINLQPIISEKINPLNFSIKFILAIIIPVLLFILGIIFSPYAGEGQALFEDLPVNIYPDSGGYAVVSGALLGLLIGCLLEEKYVKYDPSELNSKQIRINLLIELAILIPLYFILEFTLDGNVFTRFIRYAILAFILVFIGPLIFKKINSK